MFYLQAESELSDKTKREELDAVIKQARVVLLREMDLPVTIENDDYRLHDLTPPWQDQVRAKSKELLIDEEVRRRKYAIFLFNIVIKDISLRLSYI